MNPVEYPFWAWIIFFAVVLVALFLDIGLVDRRSHAPRRKETLIWSAVWVGLAVAFAVFVLLRFGLPPAKLFATGYLIELSLSVDNLFVFLLIFNFFKVPKKFQHRVLFWGVLGALLMRMIMIFGGAELVERFHWVIYLFGGFLVYTGLNMFRATDDNFEPHEHAIVRLVTKYVRISKHYDGDRFFSKVDGVRTGTLLLMVLITIEFTDLVFAVDSIPAIFGITTDRFIVYTSNIFAIMGLRTFYFLLSEMAGTFHLLRYGLAFVLSFIGGKMLLPLAAEGYIMLVGDGSTSAFAALVRRFLDHDLDQMVINISLAVVAGTILLAIVLSMVIPGKQAPGDGETDVRT